MNQKIVALIDSLKGQAGLIIGDPQNIEFSYQENRPFPAASIIKLYVLWELYRQVDEGSKKIDEIILLPEKSKVGGFGVLSNLREHLPLTLRDLGVLMIIVSDNTATNLLIDHLGITNIQKTASQMGWTGTKIARKMFDEQAQKLGLENYTTATDTANLLARLLEKGDDLSQSAKEDFLHILINQKFNNKLPGRWPRGSALFAHKTGEIKYNEHDAGILFTPQGSKLIVALTGELQENWHGVLFQNELGEVLANFWK